MDARGLIELLEVKEKQALAFTSIYKDKLDYKDLQTAIDEYCNNMILTFIKEHEKEIYDKEINIELRRYISSIGADKPHSGKRVFEALYKNLNRVIKR